jgi:hypothetical protein
MSFSPDNINQIVGQERMLKPYRNVIKRYWTEEEVSFKIDLISLGRLIAHVS